MSLMALHEDNPLSDYVYFPIVKLDYEYFTNTLGVSPLWGNYTEGTSFGKRFHFGVTNDFIYRGLSTNCPRTVFDDTSIIKNNNTWELVDGVYSRPDTAMTRIDNEQPEDWTTNIHYYTMRINTPTEAEPNQYVVYVPKKRGGTFSASTTYYRDDSEPEKRQQRLFYTDAGLSFEVNTQANFTSTAATAQPYKYYSICCWNGNSDSNSSTVMSYPEYWSRNSSVFNPQYETSYDVSFKNWYIISPSNATSLTGWSRLLDEAPTAMFFVETTVENVKYYGVALIRLSSDQEDAYPTYINCIFFENVYWGASVVPGGDTPSGQWGPSSAQGGGQGTWDYTTETVPEVDTTYLPTFGSANGGVKMYYTDNPNINNLAARLYNPDDITWLNWDTKQYSPQQAILGLHYLPSVFVHQDSATEVYAYLGTLRLIPNEESGIPGVKGYIQSNQYVDSPTYTLNVPALSDSYMDYLPYTSMTLHVPFCGGMDIDPSKVTGGSITVKYRCDISNGNVSARVTMRDKFNGSTISYLMGNCAYQIPLMSRSTSGGMSMITNGITSVVLAATGNPVSGLMMAAKGMIGGITNSGSQLIPVSSSTMPLSDLSLWLEVTRAIPSTPENKQEMRGISANIYRNLITLKGTGYMKASSVHLRNMPQATEQEKTTIKTLLESGVIL